MMIGHGTAHPRTPTHTEGPICPLPFWLTAFGDAAAVQAQRLVFREALAAVPATPAEADLIVAEARWAFEQHQRLFEQLMAHPEA